MLLSYLTLFTALSISAVAIWYSVAGLAAIFAAAVVPIIIMGGTLEVAKLVTVVWLHRFWDRATWWLKTYLTTAVVVLMFITSMGIFGFLSNAHVQQTAQGESVSAQLERIDSEIQRQESIISRAEETIRDAREQGVGADSNIQAQIDREQERIDRVYERISPSIQEQRDIIDRQKSRLLDQISSINNELAQLDDAISSGDIATAQSMVGVDGDGILGPNTRAAISEFRSRKADERNSLESRLDQIEDNPRVVAAREEIQRLRSRVEDDVADSNELITRLRSQLGSSTAQDIDDVIDEQTARISDSSEIIDNLREEKFEIETQIRQLEAEVGPIKYIAEFIYSDQADKDLLEEAVRWVIVVIIFVFDPLAVLLLIASQYTFKWNGRDLFAAMAPLDPVPHASTGDMPDAPINSNDSFAAGAYGRSNDNNFTDAESPASVAENNAYTENLNVQPEEQQKYQINFEEAYEIDSHIPYDISYNINESSEEKQTLSEEEKDDTEEFYTVSVPDDDYLEDTEDYDIPHELSTGYVEYKGKRYTREVFDQLYPKLRAKADNGSRESNAGFGTEFPFHPEKGDLFLRVDYLPTKLFKWNGNKWISVDKEQTDHYVFQDAYIDHLIDKISTGEYDPDMLTETERQQLEDRLKAK